MRREASPVRPDFAEQAAKIGFTYAEIDGEPYWDESVRYVFTLRQIEDDLETATAELNTLCLQLVDRIAKDPKTLERLRLPRHAHDLIARSWARREPSLYGRFDFAYDGEGPPKLLEYNADTPTSLYESAVVQWFWMEQLAAHGELPEGADQFNSLHEKLIARWREIAPGARLHLSCMKRSAEDAGTIAYLADCAIQAGLETMQLDMGDIGLQNSSFVDRSERPIELMFKLYPWEWMFADDFGRSAAMFKMRFVEPPWKAILSNKGALALLWEMAPGHPNLLPCFFEDDPRAASLGGSYARKPIFSREGANVSLRRRGEELAKSPGDYGAEGFVRQALRPLPDFDGRFPVLGCWLVGDAPAGMGIREDVSLVTTDRARFVPHVIVG